MKKLSIAAAVAVASMSVASATPMTEVIKSMDLNGMLRLRFHNYTRKYNPGTNHTDVNNGFNRWETSAKLVFKIKADENLDFIWRFSSNANNYSTALANDRNNKSDGDPNLKTNLIFFKYHNSGLVVMGGKLGVPTPITSADPIRTGHGAGVIAQYKIMDGLTIAGGWVDKLQNANAQTITYRPTNDNDVDVWNNNILDTDIFVAALNYKNDLLNASLWYFNLPNVLNYEWIGQLGVKYGLGNGMTLTGGVDYAQSKLSKHLYHVKGGPDNHIVNNNQGRTWNGLYLNPDTAYLDQNNIHNYSDNWKVKTYVNLYAGIKSDAWYGTLGYARSNNRTGVIVTDTDAPLNDIFGLENIKGIANRGNEDDGSVTALYTKLGFKPMDKLTTYLNLARFRQGGNFYGVEYKVGADFAYNKKVKFGAYFDNTNMGAAFKSKANPNQREFQVEAKYSF